MPFHVAILDMAIVTMNWGTIRQKSIFSYAWHPFPPLSLSFFFFNFFFSFFIFYFSLLFSLNVLRWASYGPSSWLHLRPGYSWQFPNRCYLCGSEEENVNHLLIHCTVARVLWEIVLGLFSAQWVFPETVKEVVLSWKGLFVGKKRKKIFGDPFRYLFFGRFGRRGIN